VGASKKAGGGIPVAYLYGKMLRLATKKLNTQVHRIQYEI